MSVAVSTAGHYETFAGVVNNFSLPFFDERLRAFPVAYVDVLPVFNGKSFHNLVAFGSENLSVDNEVCTGYCG